MYEGNEIQRLCLKQKTELTRYLVANATSWERAKDYKAMKKEWLKTCYSLQNNLVAQLMRKIATNGSSRCYILVELGAHTSGLFTWLRGPPASGHCYSYQTPSTTICTLHMQSYLIVQFEPNIQLISVSNNRVKTKLHRCKASLNSKI